MSSGPPKSPKLRNVRFLRPFRNSRRGHCFGRNGPLRPCGPASACRWQSPYFTLSIRLSAWTGGSVKWSRSLTCKMRKIQPPAGSKRAIIKAAKHRKGALFMKIFFYTLRPWDERPCAERLAAETGIAFDGCEAYPTLENAALAAGCDAVSMTPCDVGPDMVRRFHELGVKYLCCRSIGYDHVDRQTARELGMRVSNVDYPPRGVANFAIMLMMMSL